MDGTLVGTNGVCKQGMDIAYEGTYQPWRAVQRAGSLAPP
jgi:hypothetical protein